jgi:hypothetical protein
MNPYSPPRAEIGNSPPYASSDPNAPGVSELAVELLLQTRPWVQLISVLCLLGCLFMIAGGLLVFVVGIAGSLTKTQTDTPFPAWLGLVYVPLAGIYVYPGIKLWTYATAISRLRMSRAAVDLENALRQQKSFWKYSGIAALVLIALYILLLAGLAIVGVTAAMKH